MSRFRTKRMHTVVSSAVVLLFLSCLLASSAYADDSDLVAGSLDVQAADVGSTKLPDAETYRMYNPYNGDHHYTQSATERNFLSRIGWQYEGVGWKSPGESKTPLYRMYNPYSGEHHYTTNVSERNHLSSIGWNYEGIAWYSDDEKGVPLYRLFNPYAAIGTHHYTASEKERDFLQSVGWNYEGIAWYGTVLDSNYQKSVDSWTSSISGDESLDKQLARIRVSCNTLRRAFDYVKSLNYVKGNEHGPGQGRYLSDTTTIAYAKEMLAGGGNCYRFASLFTWLARSLGYDAKVVQGWVPSYSSGRAAHGWSEVVINGQTYIFDADMEKFYPDVNWYMRTYGDPPTNYGFW